MDNALPPSPRLLPPASLSWAPLGCKSMWQSLTSMENGSASPRLEERKIILSLKNKKIKKSRLSFHSGYKNVLIQHVRDITNGHGSKRRISDLRSPGSPSNAGFWQIANVPSSHSENLKPGQTTQLTKEKSCSSSLEGSFKRKAPNQWPAGTRHWGTMSSGPLGCPWRVFRLNWLKSSLNETTRNGEPSW